MVMKASSGLRDYMAVTGSLKAALAAGFVKYYSGPVPTSANDAITGSHTLLTTLSNDATGTGINMDSSVVDGVLSKDITEIWRGVNVASGTPTFYRHVAPGDTGALSTTERRVQGAIAAVGAQINLTNLPLEAAASEVLETYVIAIPTL